MNLWKFFASTDVNDQLMQLISIFSFLYTALRAAYSFFLFLLSVIFLIGVGTMLSQKKRKNKAGNSMIYLVYALGAGESSMKLY